MKSITLIAILFPFVAFAQINIEDYRQSVVAYSYQLQRATASVDYSEYIYKLKQNQALPSIAVSGNISQYFNSSAAGNSDALGLTLQPQLSQTIYSGGLIKAEIQKARMGVEIAEYEVESDFLDICYNADYNYYNLAAMQKFRHAVTQYVDIITSLKDVVELRYKEGYISKVDLLMIQSRLSEALYEQIAIDEDYTIALQKFNILRGYNAQSEVEQVSISADRVAVPSRSSLEELLERRPDFLSSELAARQAECNIAIARSSYNPKLSMGLAGSWQPQIPDNQSREAISGALVVNFSLPIFRFGERRKSVAAYRILHENSELSTLELIDAIRLEESNVWAAIVDGLAQVKAADEALRIGNENLEISTFAYSEGLTTILDVMQAQISWLQLYTNSIWSEFNYLVAISAYKRILAKFE